MGRSERKIVIREKKKENEIKAKKESKALEIKKRAIERAVSKKAEQEKAEKSERLQESERKRPLKKALDASIKEEERQREEQRLKKEKQEKEKAEKVLVPGAKKRRALISKASKPADESRKIPVKKTRGRAKKEKEKEKAEPSVRGRPRRRPMEGAEEKSSKEKEIEKKNINPTKKIKTRACGQKEKKAKPWIGKITEVLNDPVKKKEIKKKLQEMQIDGRSEEIKQIASYIYDSSRHTIYIHGKPGTGKTHVMEKIGNLLGEEKVEVYYSNLLIDKSFRRVKNSLDVSTTVVLIVDEFEGAKKNKFFIRQKEKLERQFKREERPKYSFKVIFISNEYNPLGVLFRPYEKDAVKSIVNVKQEEPSEVDEILKVDSGVEKRDLRAVMTKQIETIKPCSKEEPSGQYHRFIKKMVDEGETDVNFIYSEFLLEMKEKGIRVMPKEVIQEIIEGYMDGTL